MPLAHPCLCPGPVFSGARRPSPVHSLLDGEEALCGRPAVVCAEPLGALAAAEAQYVPVAAVYAELLVALAAAEAQCVPVAAACAEHQVALPASGALLALAAGVACAEHRVALPGWAAQA